MRCRTLYKPTKQGDRCQRDHFAVFTIFLVSFGIGISLGIYTFNLAWTYKKHQFSKLKEGEGDQSFRGGRRRRLDSEMISSLGSYKRHTTEASRSMGEAGGCGEPGSNENLLKSSERSLEGKGRKRGVSRRKKSKGKGSFGALG